MKSLVVAVVTGLCFLSHFALGKHTSQATPNSSPPPPSPEPIQVVELPLPPALSNTTAGACTTRINPHGTGCISQTDTRSGDFTSDGLNVLATVTYVGAPASPNPASIYSGTQVIMLKADGTLFSNGDGWKCLTCGVPAANMVGVTGDLASYPQMFFNGSRALSGVNIIDCGSATFGSDACSPNNTRIYPLFLDDGTTAGMSLREMRLHPDNKHVTWNSFSVSSSGTISEINGMARLSFNATRLRYDLVNVTIFSNPYLPQPLSVSDDGSELLINRSAISVGELRGWTGTGTEVTYVGYPWESCNIDLFAVSLATGVVRRITAHPEYADPISVSPDNKWQVVLDTRGTDRMMFMSAIRTIPPITDILTQGTVSAVRNNGPRRFFEPWLLDQAGDRGTYFGQKINAAGNGGAGAINDPNWNAGADPRWSLDGTKVSYYQRLAISPSCGASNPLPCEKSPYADGREARVLVAKFISRKPLTVVDPDELVIGDYVPWGIKYTPGLEIPDRPVIPAGNYTLYGESSGKAAVSIVHNPASSANVQSVAVAYHNFSDDGLNFLSGFENVTTNAINVTFTVLDWFSNISSIGAGGIGYKTTNAGGFSVGIDALDNYFSANGTLTSSIKGLSTWYQPCNYC